LTRRPPRSTPLYSSAASDVYKRQVPSGTTAEEIALSHPGYDTRRAKQDPDCVFPLDLLRRLYFEGAIGSVAPRHFSFMGYIPRTENLLWRTAPQVGRMLLEDEVDLALLVPSRPVC